MPKFNNMLTPEQIDRLQNKANEFNLSLTEDESLRAICNHRSPDGMRDTLIQDPVDGSVRCSICGYQFTPVSMSIDKEQITNTVLGLIDILQTIKLLFVDFPKSASNFFTIIPLLEKVPELFDLAAKNLKKYESANGGYYMANNSIGAVQALANLGNIFGAGGMFNQPMQQNFGAPMGMMGQPQMAGNPAFGMNPFGFPGASQPGYTPNTAGYQYVPGQQPQAPQQSAPNTDAGTTTVEQKVQA
jgi:hypothetical protein